VRSIVQQQKGDLPEARRMPSEHIPWLLTILTWWLPWRRTCGGPGNAEATLRLLQKRWSPVPQSVDLKLLVARLLLAIDRPSEAEKQLVDVIRLDPDNIEHRLWLVQVYLLQGNTDEAICGCAAGGQRPPC